MSEAHALFSRHAEGHKDDPRLTQIRTTLVELRRGSIDRITNAADSASELTTTFKDGLQLLAKLAGHVELPCAYALACYDEHLHGVSLSWFDRVQRKVLVDLAEQTASASASELVRSIASIEAHRLRWRDAHEFISWLVFRRDDPAYPIDDRLQKYEGFAPNRELFKARQAIRTALGTHLATIMEDLDRIALRNRWRLSHCSAHALEVKGWMQICAVDEVRVRLHEVSWNLDGLLDRDAHEEEIARARTELAQQAREALGEALRADSA